MASVDAFKVRAIIEAGYDKSSLNKANADVQASYQKMSSKMKQINAVAKSTQTSISIMGAAIVGSFAAGVAAAAAFEEQFVAVKKTLDVKGSAKETEKAFENISKRLRELVKLAPITTQTVNEIAAIGGQLGVAASQIVSFTDTVQKLTIATNLSAEQAALSMARLSEITGASANDLDNLGSSLVALGNNFAAQESEIITAAMQIATSTAQISGEMNNAAVDAMAFATALKAIGQPSQAGATAIVRLMSELSEAVALGGSNLKLFADVAGLAVPAFKELFELDSTQAVTLFIAGLEDTSKLGMTNISVLQKLGLGQVRTQKAILATSKASDTLIDAIKTANAGFIENTALTTEAERRYETLVSEITKGKNVMKGEIIDFGLDNDRLKKGTEAVRSLANAMLTLVSMIRLAADNIANFVIPMGAGLTVFRAFRTSLAVARTELGIYTTATRTAAAANEFFNDSVMRVSGGNLLSGQSEGMAGRRRSLGVSASAARGLKPRMPMFEGMDETAVGLRMEEYMGAGFMTRGLRGKRGFGRFGSFRQSLTDEILDNPTLMEIMYSGQVPDGLKPFLTKSPYFGTDSSYLAQGSGNITAGNFVSTLPFHMRGRTRRMSRIGARSTGVRPTSRSGMFLQQMRLKQEEKFLMELEKRGGAVVPLHENVPDYIPMQTGQKGSGRSKADLFADESPGATRTQQRVQEQFPLTSEQNRQNKRVFQIQRMLRENRKRQGGIKGITQALKISPTSINRDIVADQLSELGFDGLDKASRGGMGMFQKMKLNRNMIGLAKSSGDFHKKLIKSREELAKGNIEGGKLAMAFDQLDANAGKFATVIKGIMKALMKMALIAVAMTLVFKVFEKFGEQKRGTMEFANSMADLSQRTQELTVNTEKLAKAQDLLNKTTDKGVVDILTPQVEQLEKNLIKQRKAMAEDIGASFIEDIMISSFGGTNKDGMLTGTNIERLIQLSAGVRSSSTDIITKQYGSAVGEAVFNLVDPKTIRANAGQLPSINDVIEALLFQPGKGFGSDDITPSGFFKGMSGTVIKQLLEDNKDVKTGTGFLALLGIDPNTLTESKLGEIGDDLGAIGDTLGMDPEKMLDKGGLKTISQELEKIGLDAGLTRQEFAELTVDVAAFVTATAGLSGENLLESSGFGQLKEGSPLAKATKDFLKNRLEDFIAAGVVTENQLNAAGNSYFKLMSLYQGAYSDFIETTEAGTKKLMDELGVTEQNLLRLAQRIDNAFKEARKSLVDLTSPLPEQNKNFNPLEALINNSKKAVAQGELESLVKTFMNQGMGLVADELASLGLAGGALGIAQGLIGNPSATMALEQQLKQTGGGAYVDEVLGGNVTETNHIQGMLLGDALGQGIIEAFEGNHDDMAAALIASMDYAVEEFKKKYKIKSPSDVMKVEGANVADGLKVGITSVMVSQEMIDAFNLPMKVIKGNMVGQLEELRDFLKDSGIFSGDGHIVAGLMNAGFGDIEGFMEDFMGIVQNKYIKAISDTQEAFGLITGVTGARRGQRNAQLSLDKAFQNYNNKVMSQIGLVRNLEDAIKNRHKLEAEGIAGNITLMEKAEILRQNIDIKDRKRRLSGDFTAAEQIAINEQEQKVAEYERMLSKGATTPLFLQAEKDTLRDMKGGFKTPEEKELFLIESALAEEQLVETERIAREEDRALHDARVAEQQAFDAVANFNKELAIEYDKISIAQEGVINASLSLERANAEFVAKAPELQEELEIIDGLYGGIAGSVDSVFDAMGDLNNMDLTSFVTNVTSAFEEIAKDQAYNDLIDLLTQSFKQGGEGFMGGYLELTGGATGSGNSMNRMMDVVGRDTALGKLIGGDVSDIRGRGLEDLYFGMEDVSNASTALTQFMGVLRRSGISTQRSGTGEIYFNKDSGAMTDAIMAQLVSLGFTPGGALEFAAGKESMRANALNNAPSDGKYSYDEDGYISDSENYAGYPSNAPGTPPGSGTPVMPKANYFGEHPKDIKIGTMYNTSEGPYSGLDLRHKLGYYEGGVEGFDRDLAKKLKWKVQSPSWSPGLGAGAGVFSSFWGGFKMGGRIPDMSHMAPRKMYMGGRDNMMRRALVGEYGPEEVRFVPGSGFLVKPLSAGGRGNNTTVENLSVNVTGVPSDPTSARRAAVEIRKALNRLDREGTAGGGLSRR